MNKKQKFKQKLSIFAEAMKTGKGYSTNDFKFQPVPQDGYSMSH